MSNRSWPSAIITTSRWSLAYCGASKSTPDLCVEVVWYVNIVTTLLYLTSKRQDYMFCIVILHPVP